MPDTTFQVIPMAAAENLRTLQAAAVADQQEAQKLYAPFIEAKTRLDSSISKFNTYIEAVADMMGVSLADYNLDLEAGRLNEKTEAERQAYLAAKQVEAEQAAKVPGEQAGDAEFDDPPTPAKPRSRGKRTQ